MENGGSKPKWIQRLELWHVGRGGGGGGLASGLWGEEGNSLLFFLCLGLFLGEGVGVGKRRRGRGRGMAFVN